MNITTLKSELEGILHGTTLNKVTNLDRVIDRAARQLLLDVDPQETIRMIELDPIFDQVYTYAAPTDLKGNGVIDIRPQVQRTLRDRFSQTYSQEFDLYKDYSLQANYNVQFNTGVKTLEINAPLLNTGIILNEADSLTGNGTWAGTVSSISIDSVNFAAGSGALKFNLTATGQYIATTMPTAVDLSTHVLQSSLFFWVYIPDADHVTSVSLYLGPSSTSYWSTGNITTQADGTAFQDGWNLIKGAWTTAPWYIKVTNNSSYSVTNSVGTDSQLIAPGGTYTWYFAGSSVVYTYDTLGGFDIPTTVTPTANWDYTLIDSVGVPGTVEESGVSNTTNTLTTAVTSYQYVRVTYNTDGTVIVGAKLNEIASRLGQVMQVSYYSKYIFRDVTTGAFQETVTDDGNLINLDTETYNLLLDLVALLCIQQVFDGSSTQDIQFYTNEYQKALKRYQGLYKSQRNKAKTQYYRKPQPGYRRFFGRGYNYVILMMLLPMIDFLIK